jgi:hypothetical protein
MEYSPFPMALFARENDKQLYGDIGVPGVPYFQRNIEKPHI